MHLFKKYSPSASVCLGGTSLSEQIYTRLGSVYILYERGSVYILYKPCWLSMLGKPATHPRRLQGLFDLFYCDGLLVLPLDFERPVSILWTFVEF